MLSKLGQNALLTGATLPTKARLLDDYCVGCDNHVDEVGDYVVIDGMPVCLDCFEADLGREDDYNDRFEQQRGEW